MPSLNCSAKQHFFPSDAWAKLYAFLSGTSASLIALNRKIILPMYLSASCVAVPDALERRGNPLSMCDRASPENSCLAWWHLPLKFIKSENGHVMNKVQARPWWPGYPAIGSSLIRNRPCLPPPRVLYSSNTKLVITQIPHPVVYHTCVPLAVLPPHPCTSFRHPLTRHSTSHRPTPFALPWVNLLIIQGSA